MVDYFQIEAVPGRMFFRCDRQRATLSTDACAHNWRLANHENSERRTICKCCPLGAVHAGEVAASMSPLKGTLTCSRCHRPAVRLIGKTLCVSCYNRERERLVGRNAKGTQPVKLPPLERRRIRYMHGDEPRLLTLERSVDTDELIVAALRDSQKRVRFAFHGPMPASLKQLRIF